MKENQTHEIVEAVAPSIESIGNPNGCWFRSSSSYIRIEINVAAKK